MLPPTSYVQLSTGVENNEILKIESTFKPIRKENVVCDNELCSEDRKQLMGVTFEVRKNCLMCNESKYCYNSSKE